MRFNQSKFAKQVGCSQQNISKLIKKGVLELGADKKLYYDTSIEKLKNFDLLGPDDKFKKSRTAKKEKDKTPAAALPLGTVEVGYKTLADLSPVERKKRDEEEIQALKDLEALKLEAKDKNIAVGDMDLSSYNYSSAKAFREYYMGQIAELDYKIKLADYVPKTEVEQTFFEASRKVRDMLLNLPNKLSTRVVGKKEPKEIESILDEEIRYILGNLSQ